MFLFLAPNADIGGSLAVVGFSQGKFSIVNDERGEKVVSRNLSAMTLQSPAGTRRGTSTRVPSSSSRTRSVAIWGSVEQAAENRRLLMPKKNIAVVLSLVATLYAGITLKAGGVLETVDITANIPSPVSGQLLGRVIGIRWDDRSIPVAYRVNDSFAEVPNPLGEPVLALPDAAEALQASFDAWNSLPTSYIDMQIVGQVANDGLAGFDFVNELTFRTSDTFAAIASSPSVELIADATFLDGDDIDEDGDSDVSAAHHRRHRR